MTMTIMIIIDIDAPSRSSAAPARIPKRTSITERSLPPTPARGKSRKSRDSCHHTYRVEYHHPTPMASKQIKTEATIEEMKRIPVAVVEDVRVSVSSPELSSSSGPGRQTHVPA